MKKILIGGAWPYANGSLHIGHIAGLLPGDVLARYWRARGAQVFYVSGSDCHGTPITIRAREEGKSPREISDFFHAEFSDVFNKLGFSYDLYTKTSDERHVGFVKQFHQELYRSPYIEERTVKQAFCPHCRKVLNDRLILGNCPKCGAPTRGDQCDACGEVLDAETIVDAKCSECNTKCTFEESTQLFLKISEMKQELTELLETHPNWRRNAISFTRRYIDEGLRDRAITRDLDWGIDVPKTGYEEKKIYIWAENVLGYLSASKVLCDERGVSFKDLFGEDAIHYYVHGKDNIPFHTIILPALLIAHGGKLRLPDEIVSSEYITLEGNKISTSKNWAIWVKDIVSRYHPDTIRYFFIANGPEKRDADFSWREFIERNNSELVGVWGNFVNRTLAFIVKYLDGRIPEGITDIEISNRIEKGFEIVGRKIEKGNFKDAIDEAFELARFGNKYYDTKTPWKTRATDPEDCGNTLFNCVQLIANTGELLTPFLPFSSAFIERWLGYDFSWNPVEIQAGRLLPDISVLFKRIDKSAADIETEVISHQTR